MSETGTSTGMLSGPLSAIVRTLQADPRGAAQQARDFLRRFPGQREALMLLIAGRRLVGAPDSARNLLQTLANAEPNLATLQYELGLLLAEHGDSEGAASAFSRVTELEPSHAKAWRLLGDQLSDLGRRDEAAAAYAKHLDVWGRRERKA